MEQDTGSKGHGIDMVESGYSSEKAGNEDSAVESPLPHLGNGDSALASPASASSADVGGCTSALLNTALTEMSKDLLVTIPVSPLESVGSPLSPSPVSSEVNLDCSSSISTHTHGNCMSPGCNRPVSRFAFHHDDNVDSGEGVARLSHLEDDSGGVKSLPVSDLCDDISRLCTSFVEPTMNGCEEKQLVCGGDVQRIVEEVELEVDNFGKGDMTSKVETGVVQLTEKIASEVQSVGEVANWSATLLPRYQCDDGECSIESCLNQFTALELMTGNNKVGCENCTQQQNQGKFKDEICLNVIYIFSYFTMREIKGCHKFLYEEIAH